MRMRMEEEEEEDEDGWKLQVAELSPALRWLQAWAGTWPCLV